MYVQYVVVAWFAANYRSLWEWADSAPFLEHLEPQAPKPGELEEEEAGGDPAQLVALQLAALALAL